MVFTKKSKVMKAKELKRLEQKVYDYESKVNGALADLAIAATQILGYEVVADFCSGNEIEFRVVNSNDMPDTDSCIRMEEVLAKLNN